MLRDLKNFVVAAFAIFTLAGTVGAAADDAKPASEKDRENAERPTFKVDTGYGLGVERFDVDSHTEIIGWKLSRSVYFGHQDGEDSGLSFVWQNDANQVSLSKDGLRLTRRF